MNRKEAIAELDDVIDTLRQDVWEGETAYGSAKNLPACLMDSLLAIRRHLAAQEDS